MGAAGILRCCGCGGGRRLWGSPAHIWGEANTLRPNNASMSSPEALQHQGHRKQLQIYKHLGTSKPGALLKEASGWWTAFNPEDDSENFSQRMNSGGGRRAENSLTPVTRARCPHGSNATSRSRRGERRDHRCCVDGSGQRVTIESWQASRGQTNGKLRALRKYKQE